MILCLVKKSNARWVGILDHEKSDVPLSILPIALSQQGECIEDFERKAAIAFSLKKHPVETFDPNQVKLLFERLAERMEKGGAYL